MRAFGEFFACAAFILAMLFCLNGCAPSEDGLLGYQSEALSLRLCGTLNGVDFSAEIALPAIEEGAARSFRLKMTAPETLNGVIFERGADGRLIASVGGVECELDALGLGAAVIYLVDAFSIEGDARSITVISGGEVGLCDVDRLTRLDFDDYTIYIDASTDLPLRIDGNEWGLSVLVEVDDDEQPNERLALRESSRASG